MRLIHKITLLSLLLASNALLAENLDYPRAYRDLGLPEYERAMVIDVGRDDSSLADGVTVTLHTVEQSPVLRAFYEAEMKNRGWQLQETVASKNMRAAGVIDNLPFTGVFVKDDLRCQIFSSPQDGGTAIRISVIEE